MFAVAPSRNLDMRQQVQEQERMRKSMNDLLIAPNNFGGVTLKSLNEKEFVNVEYCKCSDICPGFFLKQITLAPAFI